MIIKGDRQLTKIDNIKINYRFIRIFKIKCRIIKNKDYQWSQLILMM